MKKTKLLLLTLMIAIILPIAVNAKTTYVYENYFTLNTEYNREAIILTFTPKSNSGLTDEDFRNGSFSVQYQLKNENGVYETYLTLNSMVGAGGIDGSTESSYDFSEFDSIHSFSTVMEDYRALVNVNIEKIGYAGRLILDYGKLTYDEQGNISGVQEFLEESTVSKYVPDTLTLSIKESEFTHKTIGGEVDRAMEKYLSDNKYDLNSLGLHYVTRYGEDYGEASFYRTYMVNICDDDDQCFLGSGKSVRLTYSNSKDRNDTDANYVKEKIKNKNFNFYVPVKMGVDDKILGSIYNGESTRLNEFVKKLINDSSIEFYSSFEGGLGDGNIGYAEQTAYFFLFKNEIYYETIPVSEIATYQLTVPSDTKEEDYFKILAPQIEEYIKKKSNGKWNEKITSIKKVAATSEYTPNVKGDHFYQVTTDGECENFVISVVKENKENPITLVKLNKTSISLVKGKTEKIIATINPTDTTDSKTLTWTSSNTKVATVDQNGNIKAIAAGTANITVKTSNGKTATVKVTVTNPYTPITGVRINQKKLTVVTGKTGKLTATINPSNTTQSKALTWSSSNTKIATVDKNGVVKGIKKGTANITVKTSNGKTATVKVTVINPVKIKSVKLNKKTLKLELGKSSTVKATINPSNTTDSKTLTWSTSNKKVATVDKNGKITAKGAGTATITVKTSNGKKAKVKVTVSKINAKKATITAIKNQVQNGKSLKPAVQVKLNGKVLRNGTDYTVSYKNNKKAGKATVTVKFKGNYTGSKTGSFLIIPSKVNIKNPSTDKKSITVKYSKVSGAKSYQVAYRLKGTNKWNYTTKTKISKLTSGKEYEIMIRAGIKNGSKTLYGAWSNTKTIKVK